MVESVEDWKNKTLHVCTGENVGAEVLILVEQEVEEECGLVVIEVSEERLVQGGKLQFEGGHSLSRCALCWVCNSPIMNNCHNLSPYLLTSDASLSKQGFHSGFGSTLLKNYIYFLFLPFKLKQFFANLILSGNQRNFSLVSEDVPREQLMVLLVG